MIPIKLKQVVKYGGHSLSAAGSVKLTLKADYSELDKTMQLFQMINNDINVKVKVPSQQRPFSLGVFRIDAINTSGDGCSTIKLIGLSIYIEMDNLNMLPTKIDGDEELFLVRYETNVEEEESEENEKD